MTQSKIEIRIGSLSFSGEGDADWLAAQFDKILEHAEQLVLLAPRNEDWQDPSKNALSEDAEAVDDAKTKPLASFLREKNINNNQIDKFLATAVWLHAKGRKRLSTRDVTHALKEASQKRLSNASTCLSRNIEKGRCEKDGDSFFVTQEGKEYIDQI